MEFGFPIQALRNLLKLLDYEVINENKCYCRLLYFYRVSSKSTIKYEKT